MLDQILYQTNADPQASIKNVLNVSLKIEYFESEKGIVTFYFSCPNAKVQVTPTGKLSFYIDSTASKRSWEKLWTLLKQILRTADGKEVVLQDIKWLKRIRHPKNARLKALIFDDNGSIDSQLSILYESERVEKSQRREAEEAPARKCSHQRFMKTT